MGSEEQDGWSICVLVYPIAVHLEEILDEDVICCVAESSFQKNANMGKLCE